MAPAAPRRRRAAPGVRHSRPTGSRVPLARMHRRHDPATSRRRPRSTCSRCGSWARTGGSRTAAEVGRHVGVTTQAASEMCRRLAADGLVEPADGPRAASSPTAGRAAADAIFRRHALLEWLLTSVVGLAWAESDVEAMRLQGALSPRVEAKLDELLGHPETCPHGNPIDLETARRRPAGVPLSELESGSKATVLRITEEAEEDAGLLSYLEARALTPGRARHDPRPVRVARLADARGPARPGDARPPPGGPDPGAARRGRPRAVPQGAGAAGG